VLGLILGMAVFGVRASELVQHSLQVVIDPAAGMLKVVDDITLPVALRRFDFTLNRALQPVLVNPDDHLIELDATAGSPAMVSYRAELAEARTLLSIRYTGSLKASSEFSSGHLSDSGVFLHRGMGWFPDAPGSLLTLTMQVSVPPGWEVISQGVPNRSAGDGPRTIQWREMHPQDNLYLVGGPLERFYEDGEVASAQVYLHSSDDHALAAKYLEATRRYLALYARLLGPYPYEKFALVENFWETGYGMPSFTLLGPTVIRLPFIVHTSYPHEIVHNWWGNGVYVDYQSGNWSEGLTAYLSDHLLREIGGNGAGYRRDALQKYRNYVDAAEDFALVDFVSRHGKVSEAVGYNKTLMLFHMLRQRLGDDLFVTGLRALYRKHKFTRTSFADVKAVFETVSGESLQAFFDQWTRRVGAPQLALHGVHTTETAGKFRLRGKLTQIQYGEAYSVGVPILVQTETGVERSVVEMKLKSATFERFYDTRPLRLLVDPEFDIFRRLDASETPASVGELYGAARSVAVIPVDLDEREEEAYRNLARRLGAARVYTDDEVGEVPIDQPMWLLGWGNRLVGAVEAAVGGVRPSSDSVEIGGEQWRRDEHCVISVGRQGHRPLAWVGCDRPEEFELLARKLPHYAKYSYLGFDSGELRNRLKGRWPVIGSSLDRLLVEPAQLPVLEFPARAALTETSPYAD